MSSSSDRVDYADLKREVKALARSHGFPLVGITSAEPFADAERSILERIAAGLFSGLSWFTADRARQCCDPRYHVPDARSLISLGMSYKSLDLPESQAEPGPRGRVARRSIETDPATIAEIDGALAPVGN